MTISESWDLRLLVHINKRKYIFMEKQKIKTHQWYTYLIAQWRWWIPSNSKQLLHIESPFQFFDTRRIVIKDSNNWRIKSIVAIHESLPQSLNLTGSLVTFFSRLVVGFKSFNSNEGVTMELERFDKNNRTRTPHQEITDASTSTAGKL